MVEVPFKAVRNAMVSILPSFRCREVLTSGMPTRQAEGKESPSMIMSLLHDLNDEHDKPHRENVISGVAAAAYTGECLPTRASIAQLKTETTPTYRGFRHCNGSVLLGFTQILTAVHRRSRP